MAPPLLAAQFLERSTCVSNRETQMALAERTWKAKAQLSGCSHTLPSDLENIKNGIYVPVCVRCYQPSHSLANTP